MDNNSSTLGDKVFLSNEEIAEMLLYGKSWYIVTENIFNMLREDADTVFNTTNLLREVVPTIEDKVHLESAGHGEPNTNDTYATPVVTICLWFRYNVVWKFNVGDIYAVAHQ